MKPIVGYEWRQGRCKQVSFVGQDSHIHEFYVGMGSHWQSADLTAIAGAPLVEGRFLIGYDWPEGGTKQITYLGRDHHVHELWLQEGAEWRHADLTSRTGAPPAQMVTTGFSWPEGRSKQVVFIGDDQHIHELFLVAGGQWQHVDLTAITNAPLPGSNFMVGYAWSEGHCKQIAYIGRDGQIHELWAEIGKPWQHANLSAMTNAPHATDLTVGFEWREGRCKQLAFVSADQHIHELHLAVGGRWEHADLSVITNAPPARNIVTGYTWPEGNSKQITYVGQDSRVHELSVEIGRTWQHADLTQRAQAPITSILALDGFVWSAGNSKQVVYMGEDKQVRELWLSPANDWIYTDLSRELTALPVGV